MGTKQTEPVYCGVNIWAILLSVGQLAEGLANRQKNLDGIYRLLCADFRRRAGNGTYRQTARFSAWLSAQILEP